MAPYTLVDGHEGFLGQGAFGVVEKVVKDSTGEVKILVLFFFNYLSHPGY
jgi:hypothetical protein